MYDRGPQKVHYLLTRLVFLAALVLCAEPRGAAAQAVINWYQQPSLDSLDGHVACETGIPTDVTTLYAYGLGADALSQAVGWDVAPYTGLAVPEPRTQVQRGINATLAGTSAGQVNQQRFGLYVNSRSGSNPDPVGHIRGMVLAHSWKDYATQRPWDYGEGARLRLQNNYQLVSRDTQGSIQYSMIYVGLVDTVHWKSLWLCVMMFDTRGAIPDSFNRDFGGTTNVNINTGFMPGRRYSTLVTGSQRMDGSGTGTWYAVDITRQNLVNAVSDIDKSLSENYSLNPDDYAINFIGSGLEEYVPPGQQGAFGGWVGQVRAMTLVPQGVATRLRDPFAATGPLLNWQTLYPARPVTMSSESRPLPSGDGAVQVLDGNQTLLTDATAEWKTMTVSCAILPRQDTMSLQGVLAAVNNTFSGAKTDSYFAATFLRYQSKSFLRIWGNGGDVNLDFPGATMKEMPVPANAFDGNYHTLSLRIIRDDIRPLATLLWDGVEQGNFGPDPWWNQRIPKGRAGLMTWFVNPTDQSRFDDFRASWDEVTTGTTPGWLLYE